VEAPGRLNVWILLPERGMPGTARYTARRPKCGNRQGVEVTQATGRGQPRALVHGTVKFSDALPNDIACHCEWGRGLEQCLTRVVVLLPKNKAGSNQGHGEQSPDARAETTAALKYEGQHMRTVTGPWRCWMLLSSIAILGRQNAILRGKTQPWCGSRVIMRQLASGNAVPALHPQSRGMQVLMDGRRRGTAVGRVRRPTRGVGHQRRRIRPSEVLAVSSSQPAKGANRGRCNRERWHAKAS